MAATPESQLCSQSLTSLTTKSDSACQPTWVQPLQPCKSETCGESYGVACVESWHSPHPPKCRMPCNIRKSYCMVSDLSDQGLVGKLLRRTIGWRGLMCHLREPNRHNPPEQPNLLHPWAMPSTPLPSHFTTCALCLPASPPLDRLPQLGGGLGRHCLLPCPRHKGLGAAWPSQRSTVNV